MIIDSREPHSIIQSFKSKKDLLVIEEFIESGDYLLSGGYAIERKTIQDFIASISDRRLFTQLNSLVQYDNPILAIIGDVADKWNSFYYCHNRYIHNIWDGTMSTILISYPKVKIMRFDNEEEFIRFLVSLERKLNEDGKSSSRPKPMMRKPESIEDRKENALACAKGIGIKTAQTILKENKTIADICLEKKEELEKILGKKAAENLYEMLHK